MNKKWALLTVLLSIPIGGIGIDLYTPALPAMVHAFHTSDASVKLTIGLFLLGAGLSQLFLGPLSDTFGRKHLKLLGVLTFTLTNLAIVFAPTMHWVNIWRFIQGMGAGAVTSLARAKVSDVFEKHEMRIVSSYITICWALGPIIAPWLGGYIQHYFGWQYCFYFLSVYGTVVFFANALCVPETIKQKQAFAIKQILINYSTILQSKQFVGSLFFMGLCYSILLIFGVVGPFLLQSILGYSSVVYGYIALIMGVGYFSGTLLGRGLYKVKERNLILVSLIGISLSILIAMSLTFVLPLSISAFCLPVIIICCGVGVLFPLFLAKIMTLFPQITGVASALTGFSNILIASIATFIISFIMVNTTLEAILLYGAIILLLWLVLLTILRNYI